MSLFGKKKYLIFIIIPIVVIPLLFSFSNVDPALNIRFISLSLFLITLLIYLFLKIKKTAISKSLLYYLFIVFLFSLITLFKAFQSINFSDGIFEAFRFILFCVLVLLFFLNFKENKITFSEVSICFIVMTFITFCISVYQLWNLFSDGGLSHEKMYDIFATFANKNIYSEVLLVSIPFVFYTLLRGNKILKIISIVNILFSVFFITVLLTRTVWIAAVLSFFATLFLKIFIDYKSFFYSNLYSKFHKKYLFFGFVIIAVIISSVLFYGSGDKSGAFKKQVKDIFNLSYGSTKDRIELWKRTVNIFKIDPLTGCGSGSWKVLILRYGSKNLKSEDNVTFYQRPHNDYLWVLAEQGIIGFALQLAAIVFVLIIFIRKLKKADNYHDKEILLLLFFGWSCYLIFAFFSFPSERIEHIIYHSLIISFLFSIPAKNNEEIFINKKVKIVLFTFILLICIVSLYVGFIRYISENHLQKAFLARREQNNPLVVDEINEAENSLYEIDSYSTPLAWYSGSSLFLMNNIPAAHIDFLRAYRVNPYHVHVLNNLGTTYELLGKHDSASFFYNQALNISPEFEDVLLNICAVKFNLKNLSGAYSHLRNIDTASVNLKYKTYLSVVLKSYTDSIGNTAQDTSLHRVIASISSSNTWMLSLHLKSIKNNFSFHKQLLLDAEYILKNEK